MNPVVSLRAARRLTQRQLADAAGTSQPTIAAYESGAKSPTFRTLERMASAVGCEVHATYVPPMTSEERRSLELHRAIASKIVDDADAARERAHGNIETMWASNPGAGPLLGEWQRLLDLPTDDLVDVLIDPRPRARELRHVTPFAGVLTPSERWDVYRRRRGTA